MDAPTTADISEQAKIVSVAEMQHLERAADAAGHSFAAMMERAGAATADHTLRAWGLSLPSVVVLAGPGNNGGDGLVCARCLHERGVAVRVYLWKRRVDPEHDTGQLFAALAELGVECGDSDGDSEFHLLRAWLSDADVVVDALLGTGANRPIGGQLAALLNVVAECRRSRRLFVVAVDCPSGLNCDSGAVDPNTLTADMTVTFAYAKHGHYRFPGADAVGELCVADIGIPPVLAPGADLRTFVLSAQVVRPWLPARPHVSHKGSFGKLMAVTGSINYPGATLLACSAAARTGAGLVTGAVAEPVWAVVAGQMREPTWLPLPSTEGAIDPAAAALVRAQASGYDALLLGCGLTQQPATVRFVEQLLSAGPLPATLIDADGLNCLAQIADWPRWLPKHSVLTPHPAEMARLCRLPVAQVLAERWELARAKAQEWNAVVLLKGPYTVIAAPSGWLAVLPVATPALASAGTGDVLAGAIASLLAQGAPAFAAACLGAWIHGMAGLACEQKIGLAGAVASDVVDRLPAIMTDLRRDGASQRFAGKE
jgi:hydroxyethylthiazole kinase-like uncharacterized protein yjeF